MIFNNKKITIFIILLLVVFGFVLKTPKVEAVFGAGDTVVVAGDASPTGISNFLNTTWQHLKDFVLDKMATLAAKQLLHQITLSIIDWINRGFEGNPSFLSNPGAFFLDVADQVSGAFLATNGPLSALCSPFAIDIRLSLALSQQKLVNQRYECTVKKIIEAQKNGPDIIVNGQVVRSRDSSMNGFLKGDFKQGGWPAFIALTTEPQNNPYGAFLSAQGDLTARIGQRQNVIRADLQLGQGFMSWENCRNIPGGTIDPEDPEQVEQANSIAGSDPGVKIKNNKDGTQTYQTCETQTPGSVVANQLHTALNVPIVELELANDINAIIGALVNTLTTKMIGGGLKSLSSGGNNSYVQQTIEEINSAEALKNSIGDLRSSITTAIDQVPRYTDQYKQAIDILNDTKGKFAKIRACLNEKQYGTMYSGSIVYIDNSVSQEINPLIQKYQSKYDTGIADKKMLEGLLSDLERDPGGQIQTVTEKFTQYLRNGGATVLPKIDSADNDLQEARNKAQEFNGRLTQYNYICIGVI